MRGAGLSAAAGTRADAKVRVAMRRGQPRADPVRHEPSTHSFVVRIWVEEQQGGDCVAWRGHITHVPDRVRHHFEDLSSIPLFIAPYLADMGVRLGWLWRARLWVWKRYDRAG